jgi:hypothetical protein
MCKPNPLTIGPVWVAIGDIFLVAKGNFRLFFNHLARVADITTRRNLVQ